MLSKKRVALFFIFMGLFLSSFYIGTMIEINEEEAQAFIEEFKKLIEGIDAVGIFAHNTLLSLPMFVPGFGIGWGFFASFETGMALSAINTVDPTILQGISPLIIFLAPHGIMELTAYSIATSRSYILVWMIIKKTNLQTAIRPTTIEIGIVVGLLLAGGYIEYYTIKFAEEIGLEPGF